MRKRRLKRSDAFWLAGVSLLVLLQLWWLPGDPGTPSDTYSNTVEGKRGFFQTLENLAEAGALPPVRRETAKLIPDVRSTLVILSPDRYPNASEEQELATFVMNGGTLLFAPNWANPESSIPQLSIQTNAKYLHDEDLVTSNPVAAGPPTTAPAETPAENEGTETEGTGTDTQQLPAEAEDPADPSMGSAVPGQPVPAAVPSSVKNPGNEKEERTKDVVRKAVRQGTTLQPPTTGPADDEDAELDLRNVADFYTSSPLVDGSVPWRTRAVMETSNYKAVVLVESAAGTTQAASWTHGSGKVVVSASADVFSNRAMLDEDRAELAIRLVEHAHAPLARATYSDTSAPIVISEFLNASDAYRGTAVLMSPSLRSGTLQLLTIAVLAGWFGFHQFGPPRRVNTYRRRSLTESATAVGNLQFRTNSGGEALVRYLDYFRTRLQRFFGRSIGLEDTRAIAVRAGMSQDDVKTSLAVATRFAGENNTTNAQASRSIRELSQILDRLSGAGRKN